MVGEIDKPSDPVPVYTCVIYLQRTDDQVLARVANLPDLHCQAANERTALAQLVAAFKQTVMSHQREGTSIPWIDPPLAPALDEQTRLVPVHL